MESPEKDEAETGQGLAETILKIAQTTYEDGGHAMRGVHAKSHGLLNAELIVEDGLPAVLAQGLFAKAGRYPAVMRFSTSPGDLMDDSVTTPRGLAIKISGVQGERLSGSEGEETQDFVLVNGKAFNAPNAKVFLANLKLLAATTDKVEGLKKVLSAALRGLEGVVEDLGGQSPTLASLGGQQEVNILGDSFYSQAPILYGDYIAKIAVTPASPGLQALAGAPLHLKGDALREAMVEYFRVNGGEWDVRVQLCTNLETMPIENAAMIWPEEHSAYLPVARLVAKPQAAWSADRAAKGDDELAFTPWNGLAAHRPLGSVMRLRRDVYEVSAKFRAERTGCPFAGMRELHPLP